MSFLCSLPPFPRLCANPRFLAAGKQVTKKKKKKCEHLLSEVGKGKRGKTNNAIRHDMMMDYDDGTYCAHTDKTKQTKTKAEIEKKKEG